MAVVLLKDYKKATTDPVLYIDSINPNSYINEIISYTLMYIRNSYRFEGEGKRENFEVMKREEIYSRNDGYYFLLNNETLILYRKITLEGYIYNGVYIDRVFKLTYKLINKVVPKNKIDKKIGDELDELINRKLEKLEFDRVSLD